MIIICNSTKRSTVIVTIVLIVPQVSTLQPQSNYQSPYIRNPEPFIVTLIVTLTWRFMGTYKWGCKSPNTGYKYSYPTYNPTYNYP